MKDTVSKVDKSFSHNEVPKVEQECTRKSFLENVLLWDETTLKTKQKSGVLKDKFKESQPVERN